MTTVRLTKIKTSGGSFLTPAGDRNLGDATSVERLHVREVDTVVGLLREHAGWRPREGSVLVDVGACIGMTLIPALVRGYFSRAYAFEPDPDNFEILHSNLVLNGLTERVTTARLMLGEDRREVGIRLGAHDNAGSFERARSDAEVVRGRVTQSTLAEEVPIEDAERVSLVWADIQGCEPHLLAGCEGHFASVPFYLEVSLACLERQGGRELLLEKVASRFRTFLDVRGDLQPRPISAFAGVYDDVRARGHKLTNVLLWE